MNVYVNNKQLNLNVCELENDLNTLKHPIRSRYRGFFFYNNGLINDLDAVNVTEDAVKSRTKWRTRIR